MREASRQEILRRYFRYHWEYRIGAEHLETVQRVEALMQRVNLKVEDRKPLPLARQSAGEAETSGKGNKGVYCGAAIELPSGEVIAGKNSPLFHSGSAAVLNAIKQLAGIPDNIDLLPASVISNLTHLKRDLLGMSAESLDVNETLVALSISATANPAAEAGINQLANLKGCEMHMTHIPSQGDHAGLRRLGIHLTTDAEFTPGGYFLR